MPGVLALDHSPGARLRPVAPGSVELRPGLWHDRVEAARTVGLPALLDRLEEHGVVDNLRGVRPRRGLWFSDSDLFKAMEAAAWFAPGDDEVGARLDELVDVVVAAQEPDGYLNAHVEPDRRFADLAWSHELYCAGHLVQAAVADHRSRGDERLLRAAVRLGDLLVATMAERADTDLHPGVEMALVELSRETGDPRYRRLAADLVARIDLGAGPELWGHAVRAQYFAAALADLAMEPGGAGYAAPVDALWRSMVERRSYVTGAVGGRWLGEAVGRDYELPHEGAYGEVCAAVAASQWAARMLARTGDAAYADQLELVVHNALLAGPSLRGDEWFYATPLAFAGATEHDPWATDRVAEEVAGPFPLRRRPWRDVTCCPPNALRTLAALPGLVYSTDPAGDLWVHLFIASRLRGAGWDVEQRTEMPWRGEVELAVRAAPAGATLHVRRPGWAGEPGYVLHRVAAGDVVRVELPLVAELLHAHPRVAEARGALAVRRGPLVYCAEGVDNPGCDVLAAAITGAPDRAVHRADLLGGVTVVEAPGVAPDARVPLYGPQRPGARPVRLALVPYYAWANRGLHPMAVWLGDARG